MKKIVIERHLLIKEVWTVPDAYELGENPATLHGNRTSIRSADVSPVVYREMIPGEAKEPSLGTREHDRAEQGYWSRLMKAWKASLKG
ncbi:hypothetical protein IB276_22415 [Ensifer sp. ENS04]|uniref:hypothetical protein n=1 Tax=Ensifer sp. ENS04 TaxID=2769281 RepID=UPI00177FA568|nr:hypothetical protein [Ensifer sp. ENS04]MBD9542202.1 hypothetical protein [Ensifer sp. ENS04]